MDALDLDDLCSVVGYTATRAVAAWFGGRYLHVPVDYREDHPLRLLIGEAATKALIRNFTGERLRIPHPSEEGRYRRERAIAEMLALGASPEAIAGCFDLSSRRVEQLRVELGDRGWLTYAEGQRRPRGRLPGPAGRLTTPEIFLGPGEVSQETPLPG